MPGQGDKSTLPLRDVSRRGSPLSSSDAPSGSSSSVENSGTPERRTVAGRSRGQTIVNTDNSTSKPYSAGSMPPAEDGRLVDSRRSSYSDIIREINDGDSSTRGGTSFDSILEMDDLGDEEAGVNGDIIASERRARALAANNSNSRLPGLLARLWPMGQSSSRYEPLGGQSDGQSRRGRRQRRRRLGEDEPIWNKRMLLLPAVMIVSMAIACVIIGSIAWWRQWQENPALEINKHLFPYTVNRDALSRHQHSLRLIHTNDLHAHFLPFDSQGNTCDPRSFASSSSSSSGTWCVGGSAYTKSVVDHLRNGKGVGGPQNTLLFNAGDEFQGSVYFSLFKGNMSAQLLNAFGYDAITLGNHEFDEGPRHLAKYLKMVRAPAICANLNFTSRALPELQSAVQPFTIVERHKVGVIGVLTPETMTSSSIGEGVKITDPVEAVNRYRAQLNRQGIHRVIVLSHLGYDADRDLAERVEEGVSLIIGGHSHTYLAQSKSDAERKTKNKRDDDDGDDSDEEDDNEEEDGDGEKSSADDPKGPYPTWVKNKADPEWHTAIVQAKSWGEYVGYLDLVFNDDGTLDSKLTKGQAVSVDVVSKHSKVHGIKPNKRILDIIKPFAKQAEEYTQEEIGKATVEFPAPSGNRDPKELTLGDLVADALVWADKKAHIALLGTGAIRGRLPRGKVTRGDLLNALPFDDSLSSVNLRGEEVRRMVKAAIEGETEKKDKVLSTIQVSGIRLNSTVVEVRTRIGNVDRRPMEDEQWELLDDTREYSVLAPSFLIKGGDNILDTASFNASQVTVVAEQYRDLVELYITHFSPVSPTLDHRIH